MNPDEPMTEAEYDEMKVRAVEYGTGPIEGLVREDRAFLLYEIYRYEAANELPLTFDVKFTDAEVAWWQTL